MFKRKQHSFILLLLIFCVLNCSFNSKQSNISIFFSKDAVKTDIKNQLYDISKTWDLVGSKFEAFTIIDKGSLSNSYYSFDGLEVTQTSFNPKQIQEIDIEDNSEVICEGGRAFEGVIKFNYKYQNLYMYSDEGRGEIAIYSNDFLFKKAYDSNGKISGDLQITLFTKDANITEGKYKDNVDIENFITIALTKNLAQNIQHILLGKLKEKIFEFYNNMDNLLTLKLNAPNKDHEYISKKFVKVPLNQIEGVTYYLSGEVVDKENGLKYLEKAKDYDFDPAKGSVQFFITSDFFNKLGSHLVVTKDFIWNYNNSNFPRKKLSYELDVAHFGLIYPSK